MRLTPSYASHYMPKGSVWSAWSQYETEPAIFDGLVKIDSHDKWTVYFTYDSSHKNAYYESRLMGKLIDWRIAKQGKRIWRTIEIRPGELYKILFCRIADTEQWDKYKPERLAVCPEYRCEAKQGPIAQGFPANY